MCNTSCTTLFSKTVLMIRLDAHIRTIVVLAGGKLTGIYFLYLLYTIYFFITTHRRKYKKVSFIPSGDVNSGFVSLRRDLIEDNLYRVVGFACLSCN
jgi:hypothetical protein